MFKILYFDSLDSTNKYVKENLSSLSDKTAVVAKKQTNGRGRMGKTWSSCETSLTFSYLVNNIKNPASSAALNAIAVIRAIRRLFDVYLTIKWPNDILLNDKKVCGILCESRHFGDGFALISGIGINLSGKKNFFDSSGLSHATSLPFTEKKREALLFEILKEAEKIIYSDFKDHRREYISNCINIGREIRLIRQSGSERLAMAVSIDENGYLVCKDGDEIFIVNAGEVSVRGINGYA
ncbi:MAG: biotin--[acetyl-CoA-carboxylase] ligase [Eubacterium sp.]|jgi:BirA family biotin operon repressor/biotin-[acetyl-CoA-carboxylase] ligase|nr:biotin--[acetyl-CoA-carboxylase] ligase [Eubacterium sp.]